ncbi:hypothetical protein H5410_064284 [Solanum commersonii]|uniref:Uncharacterized protein n=1 Tax=Solanum commersonii TaxID=4109 RepID=A0A9J5VZY4_SOLCO|nr:hypothetical protein H5410_064284 [Solanum commersonii]
MKLTVLIRMLFNEYKSEVDVPNSYIFRSVVAWRIYCLISGKDVRVSFVGDGNTSTSFSSTQTITVLQNLENDVDVLPPPTKLTLTSFPYIKQKILQATTDLNRQEFGILAIVVNCFPPRYLMSMNKWLQELIVMDIFKQTFTLTIWDQGIIKNEGNKMLQQLSEYPIILARRVGGSRYNGVLLTTKFNTTILIDPPYPQCQQQQAWVTQNKGTLTSFTLRSTSKYGYVISVPVDEQVIPIANAES